MIQPVLLPIASDEHTHSALIHSFILTIIFLVATMNQANCECLGFSVLWWAGPEPTHAGNYVAPSPNVRLQLHKGLSLPCVAFHAVRANPSLVLAMSSAHLCCLGTRTLDTDHPPYLHALVLHLFSLQLESFSGCWLYWFYPDENLSARGEAEEGLRLSSMH